MARLVLQDEGVRQQEVAARRQRRHEPLGHAGERIAIGEVVENFRAHDQVEALRQRVVEEIEAAPIDVAMGTAAQLGALQGGLGNVGGDEPPTRAQQLGEPALRTGELHCLVIGLSGNRPSVRRYFSCS